MRTLALLLLASCAYGVEDPLPPSPETPAPKVYTSTPKPRKIVCEVVRVDETNSGCTIYTLACEGERQFAVICDVEPMGEITDPPRPVQS